MPVFFQKNHPVALSILLYLLLLMCHIPHQAFAQEEQKPEEQPEAQPETKPDALLEVIQKWRSNRPPEEPTAVPAIKVRARPKANDEDGWRNDILVVVSDRNGNRIPEALVTIGRDSFTADADGTVLAPDRRPGQYVVTATASLNNTVEKAVAYITIYLQKQDKRKQDWERAQLPPDFDWEQYVKNHLDLQKAGINTERLATSHYVRYGRREGRTYLSPEAEAVDAVESPSKVELPPDFDWEQYVENYPDLQKAGIDTEEEAISHYASHGINENRSYKPLKTED